MPRKPAAEVDIDEALVRTLLAAQAGDAMPDAARLPLRKVAEGWDSEVWRLGDAFAVRLPRRAVAAPLVLHEQRTLPGISARLRPLGIAVPDPIVRGEPTPEYPWHWSVVPWTEGERALAVPRTERTAWAADLGRAMLALHTPAPADHPVNPYRGVPLADRDASVRERIGALRDGKALPHDALDALESVWDAGLRAEAWTVGPMWVHGDLHPGNLVVRDGSLAAIIDFGDVTAGDPAYDLAVAWLAFDSSGRARFHAATAARYDQATWTRARAWAASVALMLLAHSDDEPEYAALAQDAASEVIADA